MTPTFEDELEQLIEKHVGRAKDMETLSEMQAALQSAIDGIEADMQAMESDE